MALDARTGKRLWHYQLVHHDLWDYDLPQAPKLLTLRQNGRNVDVVAQATKHGFLFVFERKTGKPICPIEERPVPQSDVPGEQTRRRSRSRRSRRRSRGSRSPRRTSIRTCREAEQEALRQRLRSVAQRRAVHAAELRRARSSCPGTTAARTGAAPPSIRLSGEFYVVAKNMPTLMRLVLSNEEPTAGGALGGGAASPIITPEQKAQLMAAAKEAAAKGPVRYTSPYDFMQSPTNGMTAIGPPWSEITAYDLNTGEIKWRVPDGGVTAPPEAGIPADTGRALAARRSARDGRRPGVRGDRSDRTVRAYDRDTGKVVWTKDLPTGSEGVPATYEVGGGSSSCSRSRRGWIVPGALRRSRRRAASRAAAGAAGGSEPEAAGWRARPRRSSRWTAASARGVHRLRVAANDAVETRITCMIRSVAGPLSRPGRSVVVGAGISLERARNQHRSAATGRI